MVKDHYLVNGQQRIYFHNKFLSAIDATYSVIQNYMLLTLFGRDLKITVIRDASILPAKLYMSKNKEQNAGII